MAKEYVPIFLDWLETTQDLSQEEKGNLIDAVVSYAAGIEYEHYLTGGSKIAFRFLKGQVDRNTAISEARSKAAKGSKPEQPEANPSKPEQKEANDNKKLEKEQLEQRFARFWSVYPRKVAKETARKAFAKLKPDEGLLQTMIAAVEKQKLSDQWMKDNGQFIPHPATWLNNRRWDDELTAEENNRRNYADVQAAAMRRQNERIAKRLAANNFNQRNYDHVPEYDMLVLQYTLNGLSEADAKKKARQDIIDKYGENAFD